MDKNEINGLAIYNQNIRISLFKYIKRLLQGSDAERIVKLYKEKQYREIIDSNVIHAHWGMPHGYIAYLLGKEFKIPYFITLHGSDVNSVKEKNLSKLITALENADKCFFVSEELLNSAINKGYSGKNAVITYNGVDTEKFYLKNEFNKKFKKIGYVGSLEYKKGADLLPKIFSNIHMRYPSTRFKIVGDGPLKLSLKKEISNLGIEDIVEFTGNVDKDSVPIFLNDVDLVVIPSRMEGLGMVVLEANAMGIPVVGSNVGGIPEAVGNYKNVFNLDNYFIFNISKRSIEILKNEDYKNNARLLRNRVEDSFNWDSIVSIEQKFYELSIKD
ncbi:glycosyltransferase [Piscibacillus salipiscarius]|nr:glycosyltransferase [Piscibacillus salipiscarius]